MNRNLIKQPLLFKRRKKFYLATITILAISVMGWFLATGLNNATASQIIRVEGAQQAREDMLAIALNFRSAHNPIVVAEGKIGNNGTSSILGDQVVTSENAERGSAVNKDLGMAYQAINQLPYGEMSETLRGGTFIPGVYYSELAQVNSELILDAQGNPDAIFIFRSGGAFTFESGTNISLINGAKAYNVFFVAGSNAAVATGVNVSGSILARGAITLGEGANVNGKLASVEGDVELNSSTVGFAGVDGVDGSLQVCKAIADGTTGLSPYFGFSVAGTTVIAPTGSCAPPIGGLTPGPVTVVELGGASSPTATTFTSTGFVVTSIRVERATGVVTSGVTRNLGTRTVTVPVLAGGQANLTIVTFTNQVAITGVIEICKRGLDSGTTLPPPTGGFFDFTVDRIPGMTFPVPAGLCSGEINVVVPVASTSTSTAPIRVTEIGRTGFLLESTSVFPASRGNVLTLGLGISNDGSGTSFSNPGGGFVTTSIAAGTGGTQTVIEFSNRSAPGVVKVCKIAGPGVTLGTIYRFRVVGTQPGPTSPGNPTGSNPGIPVERFVDVQAGPATNGPASGPNGFCTIVRDGAGNPQLFVVDTPVTVEEQFTPVPTDGSREADQPAQTEQSAVQTQFVKGTVDLQRGGLNNQIAVKSVVPFIGQALSDGFALSGNGTDALAPVAIETGRVYLSTDGLGTNAASGQIQVNKLNGATVRRAFLMAATVAPCGRTPSPPPFVETFIAPGDITLAGTPITFTQTVATNLPSGGGNANTYLADVTSIVAPIVNAAPVGLVNLTVTEIAAKNPNIDGVVLAVVMNDPLNQPADNTVILLFGSQDPGGDNFTINLAQPINKMAAGYALNMALGISFSAQPPVITDGGGNPIVPGGAAILSNDGASCGQNPAYQSSTVDVGTNTRPLQRMTSSAGGQDDGAYENGALITVGGIGDSTTNPPDPNASSTTLGPRYDDELYNLDPFVNNGDSTINVRTINPTNDDNIFFTAFFLGANALSESITLTPASAINPLNTPHTVTATVTRSDGAPVANRPVKFTIISGPNAGLMQTINTNAMGVANFTYVGTGGPGTDVIQASFVNLANVTVTSNTVTKLWQGQTCSIRVGRIRVFGSTISSQSLPNRTVTFPARRGEVVAEFSNFLFCPTTLKLCKVAGANVPVGTPFNFNVTVDDAGGLIPTTFQQNVTINAGPPQGPGGGAGFCQILTGPFSISGESIGSFRIGSTVRVVETVPQGTTTTITSPTGTVTTLPPTATTRTGSIVLGGSQANPSFVNEIIFTNSFPTTATPTPTPPGTLARATAFDFDGDDSSDLSTFRPTTGVWNIMRSSGGLTNIQFGANGDDLAPADYDGDTKVDTAVFRNGSWYWLNSSNGAFNGVQFGQAGDIPQPGYYDADNKADIAVFRPSNGGWYILGSTSGFRSEQFGTVGDKPVAADYDGDGITDLAVYRDGSWYLQRSQAGFTGVNWGNATDRAVPADFDGDGKANLAIFRNGLWYILRSNMTDFDVINFGLATDSPAPADYDGDNRADIAVYRDGMWYILESGVFRSVQFGGTSDVPVPGAYVK